MASFAAKYNRGRLFDIDTTNFEFVSLNELFEKNGAETVYPIKALYINTKSKFGANPVIATDKCFVDLPSFMTDTVREILADHDAVDFINEGGVGFTIYSYEQKKYARTCYAINFVDLK